jgi:glycosyltransferase involved in cell wall biosynthesis
MKSKKHVCFIDLVGLPYDGDSLTKKGLGGSETAVISMSRELVRLGFSVTVLNDCVRERCQPGVYDEVDYRPVTDLAQQDFDFDIVISVRSVTPFAVPYYWNWCQRPAPWNHDQHIYQQLQRPQQLKILWLQDTFCWRDDVVEAMVVEQHINEIFTLSDWHTSYISQCEHGHRRCPEVLRPYIFQTRNAINSYIDQVDVSAKDPNHFVYNASVNKGMIPLLERVWPRVQQAIPQAHLTVIGGYYQYPDTEPDDSVRRVWEFQQKFQNDPRVKFTGIITQREVADILARASYTIYPSAFPETSGISTLESIYYNTAIIGCNFGAMAETGTDLAGDYINYAIEPNALWPNIDIDQQVERFIALVLRSYHTPYLHQQRCHAGNRVRDIATWDTVALQWLQHFYQHFGQKLSQNQQQRVDYINSRVHQVFGRRFSNPEEVLASKPPQSINLLPNAPLKLAIIDLPGMAYDGNTLDHRGMGGSESAVILISRELAQLGISVTVFNGCNEDGCSPGIYQGVVYQPLSSIPKYIKDFDVVISSRTPQPFADKSLAHHDFRLARSFPLEHFAEIRSDAKKILWMHDTFSWGDEVIESMIINGQIHEVWCLSDFHAQYFMNCHHGVRRNYEVLREHVWVTRNGIQKFDVSEPRNANLFIFNANQSKGLKPLLDDVWPRVQQRIPQALLVVIGGFYQLGSAFGHDPNQFNDFEQIVATHRDNHSIHFTGVITQKQVAEWSARASFFIYPAILPETFGISTWEALYQGTPLITNRFGALAETATDASYYMDYAIGPNNVYPHIDQTQQVERFVDLVVRAYHDPDRSLKSQAAMRIRDIAGWDTVALEWLQHLFQLTDRYVSPSVTQAVAYSKSKYQKLTGRRYTDLTQHTAPKHQVEQRIAVITPFRNAAQYLEKCILSVAAQNYSNYHHYLINDHSDDASSAVIERVVNSLPVELNDHFTLIENPQSVGAVRNQVTMIRELADDNIIMLLDGDDWLAHRSDIFDHYNNLYHNGTEFSYGSCWSVVDNIPLIAQPYPESVRRSRTYRQHRFNWGLPYTHLRTFRKRLINYVNDSAFQDHNQEWYTAGGDGAVFYALIEQAAWDRISVVSDIMYHYNDTNPLNDYKVHGELQNRNAAEIAAQHTAPIPAKVNSVQTQKRILIAIPTARYIEPQTFKSIYDQVIPKGYVADFQYFYGYRIDQIRNLIAHWVVNGYDYLFAVDSDISFAPNTLQKLLSHDVDMVSGIYRQRTPEHTIEIFRRNHMGGVSHVPWEQLQGQGLVQVDGCGFGCVLVKNQVLTTVGAPQFQYHVALDHNQTVSEDVDFCHKVTARGFRIWADTDVICDHHGMSVYQVGKV